MFIWTKFMTPYQNFVIPFPPCLHPVYYNSVDCLKFFQHFNLFGGRGSCIFCILRNGCCCFCCWFCGFVIFWGNYVNYIFPCFFFLYHSASPVELFNVVVSETFRGRLYMASNIQSNSCIMISGAISSGEMSIVSRQY